MRVLSERQYYKQIVSQNLHNKALHYDRFAFVEHLIATRLLESLDLIPIHPTRILDLGSGTGHDAKLLSARYPSAQIIALDLSVAMLGADQTSSPPHTLSQGSIHALCADAEAIPLKDHSVDMVFSNALLPWLPDTAYWFKEVHRVLKAGGLFLFSSLGPDTLKECNQVLSQLKLRTIQENALLMDMHDVGDQLVQASFESPVMDSSLLTLQYHSPFALLRDFYRTGWSYAIPSMTRSELKDFLKSFHAIYKGQRHADRETDLYVASLELVIGHAWCGLKKEHKTPQKLALQLL
jgi:malonyl-CoA O-methyltransferase